MTLSYWRQDTRSFSHAASVHVLSNWRHGSNVASTERKEKSMHLYIVSKDPKGWGLTCGMKKKEKEEEEPSEYLWEPLLLGELAGGLMT